MLGHDFLIKMINNVMNLCALFVKFYLFDSSRIINNTIKQI